MGVSGTISNKTTSKATTSSNTSRGSVTNSDAAKAYKAVSAVRNLVVGQTVQGEVLSIKGSEIELLLANDVQIQAKLDKNLSILVGQTINFEVKSNGNITVLRPLFENMAQDMNLLKALEEANLSPTNRNVQMVQSLMQQQMPVNKQMLTLLSREMAQFPNSQPDTIVSLHKMEIPVTGASVGQFEAYQGTNHYISSIYEEISTAMQKGIVKLLDNEDFKTAFLALEKMLAFGLDQEELKEVTLKNVESGIKEELVAKGNINGSNEGINDTIKDGETFKEIQIPIKIEMDIKSIENRNKIEEDNMGNKQGVKVAVEESLEKSGKKDSVEDTTKANNLMLKLGELLQKFSAPRLLESSKEIKEFVESKIFENTIKTIIEKNGVLNPREVEQKDAMTLLYKTIGEQTKGMLALADTMGKAGEEVTKTVGTLRDNVEFMAMINQTFSYVQIPVKMAYPNAKAELFVYAHKKKLNGQKDTTSALLHLDMAHVGMVDIHVLLNETKVTTKFIIEKEELLDFFAEKLPLLDNRLSKRGYVATSTIECRKENINTMDRIQQEKKEAGDILLSNQSFDARA